jgi:hypothetical protein
MQPAHFFTHDQGEFVEVAGARARRRIKRSEVAAEACVGGSP